MGQGFCDQGCARTGLGRTDSGSGPRTNRVRTRWRGGDSASKKCRRDTSPVRSVPGQTRGGGAWDSADPHGTHCLLPASPLTPTSPELPVPPPPCAPLRSNLPVVSLGWPSVPESLVSCLRPRRPSTLRPYSRDRTRCHPPSGTSTKILFKDGTSSAPLRNDVTGT